MKTINLSVFVIATLFVCSCERVTGKSSEKERNVSETFSFSGIEYVADKSGAVDDIIKTYAPIVINNNSDIEQSYMFTPQDNVYESSTFWSGDERAFLFVDDEQKVKIPVAMSDDGIFSYDEGIRWVYSSEEQKLRPDSNDSGHEITIPPHHRLELTSSFTMRSISTRYKLRLQGVEFGEEVIVEGSWSGLLFVDYDLDHTIEPLL